MEIQWSPAHENIDSEVSFIFDVCLEVSHFKVVVHPVNNEVREPGILTLALEQPAEQFKAVLPEVISEHFEAHEGVVLREGLGEQSQTEVINLVVGHV